MLIPHAAMRYYALLHGGQSRAERLTQSWGTDYSHCIYDFNGSPKDLIGKLSAQLDSFGKQLSNGEYLYFEKEVIIAWIYAGELVGVDIRPLIVELKT